MRTFRWYLGRLGRMSLPEVCFRVVDSFSTIAQRNGFLQVKSPTSPTIVPSESWFEGCQGLQLDIYERAGRKIMAGESPIFALEDGPGTPAPHWNRDPLTGTDAPLIFGKSVKLHSKEQVGNIKYLWEQNRHLELVTLAQSYRITGNNEFLENVRDRLSSWLDQCPYMRGPNWASSLELAIRLINWSITWQLIGKDQSPLFHDDKGAAFRERWLRSIYQHVHFIRGNYSRFSSANNHLIGEASGVFVATCTWPYWSQFTKWGAESRKILIDEIGNQVHSDGVNKEQAISYQQFVLDFFILAGLAGNANNLTFPKRYWKRIKCMVEFIHAMMDIKGNLPMIGDADDGLVVRLSQGPEFCPYRSLLATAAILFDRSDFAIASGGLDDKTRFLLGENRWNEISQGAGKPFQSRRKVFPEGGYYILGSDCTSDREIHLIVDSGPLGYLSIAAHGHADALSIYLSLSGREFLLDPGTYSYDAAPEWRSYFRSSRAHNTVTVDGLDQSIQAGNFMWTEHAASKCVQFQRTPNGEIFVGQHDGYCRLSDPVFHERRIIRESDVIQVSDTLKCRKRHVIERAWHFSERCDVATDGQKVFAENDGIRISLSTNDPMTRIVCLEGSANPMGGWVSRAFDVKSVSTSVYFVNEIEGTTSLSTRIKCFV